MRTLSKGVVIGVCLVATALVVGPAHAAFPGKNGRIVFRAGTNFGNVTIYSMNPDGSSLRQLTLPTLRPTFPEFSPDSREIVFTRDSPSRGGNNSPYDLYKMDADGSALTRLVAGTGGLLLLRPFWLSNSRIGIITGSVTHAGESLEAIDRTGGARQVLFSANPPDHLPQGDLAASPDGRTLAVPAFPCTQGFPIQCTSQIRLRNLDGSVRTALTLPIPSLAGVIDWAPDGQRLAFNNQPGGSNYDTYIINADGSGLRRLTSGYNPAWSPDGRQILFTRSEPLPHLYVINADGSGERLLLGGRWRVSDPSWGSAPLLPALPPVRIAGRKSQRFGRDGTLRATASCTLDCKIRVQATVSVNLASKLYKSKKVKLELAANGNEAIRLRFPAKAVRAFRSVLKRGKRLKARITAVGKDLAGTSIATTRRVRLRK